MTVIMLQIIPCNLTIIDSQEFFFFGLSLLIFSPFSPHFCFPHVLIEFLLFSSLSPRCLYLSGNNMQTCHTTCEHVDRVRLTNVARVKCKVIVSRTLLLDVQAESTIPYDQAPSTMEHCDVALRFRASIEEIKVYFIFSFLLFTWHRIGTRYNRNLTIA